MRHLRLLLGLLGFVAAAQPVVAQRELFTPEELAVVEQKWPEAKRGPMSLRYIVHDEGQGEPVGPGDRVTVNYRGTFLDGRLFDETGGGRPPFVFRVARGEVIPGWDIAMQMMREGGKMLVIIPPEMAYGTRGDPPRVPRRATLVFEISLEKIERTTTPPPPPPPQPPKKKKWWSLEKTQ